MIAYMLCLNQGLGMQKWHEIRQKLSRCLLAYVLMYSLDFL